MVCGLTMGPHEHMSYAIGGRWLLRPHHSFDRQRRVLGPTGAAREAFERWGVVILNIQNQIIVATLPRQAPSIGVGMIIQEMCEPVGVGGGGCDHHVRRRGVRRPSRSSYARGEVRSPGFSPHIDTASVHVTVYNGPDCHRRTGET